MPSCLIHTVSPEREELEEKRRQLETLNEALAQRELNLATLNIRLERFGCLYFRIVGARYAELDDLEARVAAIRARLKPDSPDMAGAAHAARERAEHTHAFVPAPGSARALASSSLLRRGLDDLARIDGSASAHFNLGYSLCERGRFDEAIDEFRTVIRLDPNNALPYNNLGVALEQQERNDEAIEEYRTAILLDPDYTLARSNLSATVDKQARIEDARSVQLSLPEPF